MYQHLTKLRLRGYGLATGRILMRHWQMFIIAGVFVPAGIPIEAILFILAFPLIAVFTPGHDLLGHLSYLALIQAIALLWVLVQKSNIAGNEFTGYVNTLPISLSLRRRVNLTLLLAANSILLVPVIGLFLIAPTRLLQTADKGFLIAAVSALVMLVLLIQLAAFERQRAAFWSLALADILLSWSLSRPVDSASWLALCATLVSASLSLLPYKKIGAPTSRQRNPQSIAANLWARLPPDWRIQAKALWLHHPASSATRMGATIAVAAMTVGLMNAFNFDGRTLPAAILAMGLIALIVSGLYRVLQTLHLPMQHYLSGLPLHKNFWVARDTASVLLFGAVPLVILLIPMRGHADIKPVLALILAYWGLLALLRLPLVYGGKQAMLFSVMLAGTWSGAAMAAIL